MATFNHWRKSLAVAGLALLIGLPEATMAGPRQTAILQSYVGDWSGEGELVGGDEPETFSCRNKIKDGGEGKINYQGRCAVAGLNLAIYGTVKYDDDKRRYLGVMYSNTEFSGEAIGRQSGSNIVFDFKQQKRREGQELTIGAKLILKRDTYTVDFDVWIAESKFKMSTSVPFERN